MSNIFEKNETNANKSVAKVMQVTLAIFTVILILDYVNVFIITKSVMTTAYLVSAVILLLPTVLNHLVGASNKKLKYLYIILACLFIFLISSTLTFHVAVVYAYPIAIASMYFSSGLVVFSIILTILVTICGQILGYIFNFTPDLNFYNIHRLVIFGIIPRIFTTSAFASLLLLLTRRTNKLLKYQEKDMKRISNFDNDMLTAFASLVESRDKNTGGHIIRTRAYVKLIVNEMHNKNLYPKVINDEFIENIIKAAPLHDIGKIAIKDNVLQKEGKLTPEEFEEMKKHSIAGGDIIKENFSHIGNKAFRKTVYEVARFHHEKWNGRGYPDGLKGDEIPLCARIMTIADVFDAVSQKRCYREAMPIEECFDIIKNGSGVDFDPVIAEIFLSIKDEVINEKAIQDKIEENQKSI